MNNKRKSSVAILDLVCGIVAVLAFLVLIAIATGILPAQQREVDPWKRYESQALSHTEAEKVPKCMMAPHAAIPENGAVACECIGWTERIGSEYIREVWAGYLDDVGLPWTPRTLRMAMDAMSYPTAPESVLTALATLPTHCDLIAGMGRNVPQMDKLSDQKPWRVNPCQTACRPERCFCKENEHCAAHGGRR